MKIFQMIWCIGRWTNIQPEKYQEISFTRKVQLLSRQGVVRQEEDKKERTKKWLYTKMTISRIGYSQHCHSIKDMFSNVGSDVGSYIQCWYEIPLANKIGATCIYNVQLINRSITTWITIIQNIYSNLNSFLMVLKLNILKEKKSS